jgi:hypothetical protein
MGTASPKRRLARRQGRRAHPLGLAHLPLADADRLRHLLDGLALGLLPFRRVRRNGATLEVRLLSGLRRRLPIGQERLNAERGRPPPAVPSSLVTPSAHRRYEAWRRRYTRSGAAVYGELWAPQPDHPAREALDDLATDHLIGRLGRTVATDYLLSRTLPLDVMHAGGGVEYHAERVLDALAQAQHDYDQHIEQQPEDAWSAEVEFHALVPTSLAWEYSDLLTWLRGVEERIDRRVPGSDVRVGLLPAIGDAELRSEVERLLAVFTDRVGDERLLANYGLHAAQVPNPNTPSGLVVEGNRVIVPIPDPPTERVDLFDQFTYEENRDLRTFTAEALAATEAFMDDLLTAFEQAAGAGTGRPSCGRRATRRSGRVAGRLRGARAVRATEPDVARGGPGKSRASSARRGFGHARRTSPQPPVAFSCNAALLGLASWGFQVGPTTLRAPRAVTPKEAFDARAG